MSRQEAGIGTRGPGETQLEVDRRAIRKKIGHLKAALKKIESQRDVRRKHRREFKKAAIVGYTNVGKSRLLNSLTHAEVFVENRLFATLDATIRAVPLEGHRKILLIDTVGFIRKLPHHLVASFRSTLEETIASDLLLHVVDISHPRYEEQIGTAQGVLRDLGIHRKPTIMIFNKIDLLKDRQILGSLKERFPHAVFTSALKGIGLESLKQEIVESLKEEEFETRIHVPVDETKIISFVHEVTEVIHKEYLNGVAVIHVRATTENIRRIHLLLEKSDDPSARG